MKSDKSELRNLLYLGLILAFLLIWRLLSPYSIPKLKQFVGSNFTKLWSEPYFHLGGVPVNPSNLTKAFVFLVLLVLAVRISRNFARRHILDYTSLDVGQKYALERGLGYLIFAAGLVVGLQSAGVNLNSLVVFGGAVGIGIGLGLQDTAKNFVSGIILLVERPIKVGDRVEVGALNGDVVRIGARATWIRTNANIVVIVPNAEFVENRVTNWTANDRQVRFSVPVGVSYGSDPEKVRDVLLEIAQRHPDVLDFPAPDVIFAGFGDSSLNFELRVWTTKQVQTPHIIKSDLYFPIFRAFRDKGIEIPFPQRDLHLRSVSLPIPIANTHQQAAPTASDS
jgi:small-conductance mechanosensitive channel